MVIRPRQRTREGSRKAAPSCRVRNKTMSALGKDRKDRTVLLIHSTARRPRGQIYRGPPRPRRHGLPQEFHHGPESLPVLP